MTEGAADRDRKLAQQHGPVVRRVPVPERIPVTETPSLSLTPGLRLCPSPIGYQSRLIVQAIRPSLCLQRQREFYHKCHRCLYRGKPADYVLSPDEQSAQTAQQRIEAGLPPLLGTGG